MAEGPSLTCSRRGGKESPSFRLSVLFPRALFSGGACRGEAPAAPAPTAPGQSGSGSSAPSCRHRLARDARTRAKHARARAPELSVGVAGKQKPAAVSEPFRGRRRRRAPRVGARPPENGTRNEEDERRRGPSGKAGALGRPALIPRFGEGKTGWFGLFRPREELTENRARSRRGCLRENTGFPGDSPARRVFASRSRSR